MHPFIPIAAISAIFVGFSTNSRAQSQSGALDSTPTNVNWALDFLGPDIQTPDGRTMSAGARYWSEIVGVPFTRDAVVDIPRLDLDLNLDGSTDTVFEARYELRGGILANAALIGLDATPNDPAGSVGTYSISSGFLGVREEMNPATRRGTGRFAFNCWICHGSVDADGGVNLGRPNTDIQLGLIMAASNVMNSNWVIRERPDAPAMPVAELMDREGLDASMPLDPNSDGQVTIAEWRAALRMPPAEVDAALLLLAGPGRLDQSIDRRMDGHIPLANMQQRERQKYGAELYLKQAKVSKASVFNPVSVPSVLSGLGVRHYSYSAKDSSTRHAGAITIGERLKLSREQVLALLHMPADWNDMERIQRALTLDFRNMGTFGLEVDHPAGMGWAGDVIEHPAPELWTDIAPRFGAYALRELLTAEPPKVDVSNELVRRGQEVFTRRATGTVINQRVVWGREVKLPRQLEGIAALTPIDRSKPLDAKVEVRCATCHNYSPLSRPMPIKTPLEELQRCDICHLDHPVLDEAGKKRVAPSRYETLAEYMTERGVEHMEECLDCHENHPDFGPQVFSNSWALPFDANANRTTHGDEIADGAAGGIGTDANLNVDTLFTVQRRRLADRPTKMYLVTLDPRVLPAEPQFSSEGNGWVRVTPLRMLRDTAPYLHNGSVPTLADLLKAPANRPRTFSTGNPTQRFTFNASLPGNLNTGHAYGTELSADDQLALIAYLNQLR